MEDDAEITKGGRCAGVGIEEGSRVEPRIPGVVSSTRVCHPVDGQLNLVHQLVAEFFQY